MDNNDRVIDEYFASLKLDQDLDKITKEYGLEDDDMREETYLSELRNDNHYRYHNIDFNKFEGLTEEINVYVKSIKELYKLIDPKILLDENLTNAEQHKTVLNMIYDYIKIIDKKVENTLKLLTPNNNKKQSKFSIELFSNLKIPTKVKNELIDLYSELVVLSSYFITDNYENLKVQVKRKRNITRIYSLLGVKEPREINIDKSEEIDVINNKIEFYRKRYLSKMDYLADIMPKGKEFSSKYEKLRHSINFLFSYDDRSILAVRRVYDKIQNSKKLDDEIKNLEALFIDESERIKKEKKFVFDKVGLKNIKRTLDYISVYYMDILDDESKKVVTYIINNINAGKYIPKTMNKALKIIVSDIWSSVITHANEYNVLNDYYFICSNNPFLDEKYETILITRNEVKKVNNYEDYQIGFICKYDDNVLYITENEDIMSVKYDDMSNLKTPKQIEDEFINFKVCNRIALNGFKTVLEAVYMIDDGDEVKLKKALDLSSSYDLPLIRIKKDN